MHIDFPVQMPRFFLSFTNRLWGYFGIKIISCCLVDGIFASWKSGNVLLICMLEPSLFFNLTSQANVFMFHWSSAWTIVLEYLFLVLMTKSGCHPITHFSILRKIYLFSQSRDFLHSIDFFLCNSFYFIGISFSVPLIGRFDHLPPIVRVQFMTFETVIRS